METERLLIRPLTASDTPALHAVLSDAEVMRFVEAPFSLGQTAAFIERISAQVPAPVQALVWKKTGELVGQLIYHPYDAESWELGWILRRDFWGRGIAAELTEAALADARQRRIPALVIECAPEQRVTRHIAEKLGFRFLGEEAGLALYRRTIDFAREGAVCPN